MQMEMSTSESFLKESKVAKENFFGRTGKPIEVSFLMESDMERESGGKARIQFQICTMENLKTIERLVMEYSNGRQAIFIKGISLMMNEMALAL